MVGTLVHQLTRNLNEEQIKTAGFDTYFVDHTVGVYPQFASGYPWSASTMQVTGDIIADLTEDLAAEQKARLTYDNILRLSDDPDVNDVIRFLREREVVHFQRFGDTNHTKLSRFQVDFSRKNSTDGQGFPCPSQLFRAKHHTWPPSRRNRLIMQESGEWFTIFDVCQWSISR